jgi:hypothetical protein
MIIHKIHKLIQNTL